MTPGVIHRAPKTIMSAQVAERRHPADLEPIANCWQRALDADYKALNAAEGILPSTVIAPRRHELVRERQAAELLLARLAHTTGAHPVPWLAALPLTNHILGLPDSIEGCVFDLDGVLTDSGLLHAQAWTKTFDPFLQELAEKTGWQLIPFDREHDYRNYLDGRPRLEGVHAFLASRGIRLPEGRPEDAARSDTAFGIARRKGENLTRELGARGVTPLEGARRYLEAAGRAGLERAVVSASTRTLPMLELAGLDTLVETRVDAETIQTEGLRARPAPDLLLTACDRLGLRPEAVVTFTHSPAGVAAGRTAGLMVVGVGRTDRTELLRCCGADQIVGSLGALLDGRILALH